MNLLHSSARRRLTSSLGVLLSLVAVDCLAASPPLLTIGPLDHPAKIDGRIGEGEWDGALPVTAFVRPGGELAAAPFTCRVAYDTKGLVVLWQCEGAPLYERRGHDGSLWQDDAVEVFLMPPDSADYYQFIGSAGGDIYEGKGRDSSWDAQWRFVPAVSAESWQAEMRIPFAAFSRSMPAAGETWRVNFCRDAQKPIIEISSWAPVAKGFHEPESFGHLRFGEAPAPAVMSSLSPSAGHGVTIMPSLRTGGRLQVTLLDGEKQLSAETAADDSPVEINLEHPGSFILRIAGMDEAQQLVFQQEVAVVRKPPLRLTVSKRLLTHRDAQVEMDCSGLEQAPDAYRVTVGEAEPVEVEASAAHRDRATISVDLSSVPAGQEVKLVAAALRGGKVIAQAEETLVVPPVPEWLGSDVGRSDALPAPWTPVVAEGTSVACWGREYRFAERALPAEIVTAGEQILSSPVRLLVNVDGARQRWDQARLRWGETGDTAATGLTTAKSQQAELRAKITAEFDGLMRVDLEVDPVGDAALEEVVLEIPIVAAHARYLHACDASWGGSVSGALPEDDWQHHFMPFVWLGDEERGLQWFCESDAGWRPAKADKVLVVSRHRGAVVLRVNMLEQPLEPGASFRTTFGLQATPVKPIPPEWRQWHIAHGAFYGMQDSMVTSNLGVSYPAEGNIDLAQGSVDMWVQPRFDPQVEVERATRGRYNRSLFGVELANGDHWGFYWNIDDRCVRFYNRVGGKVQITLPSRAPQPWKQGEWHHVAFTWGDEAVIYVDGKKVASRLAATPVSSSLTTSASATLRSTSRRRRFVPARSSPAITRFCSTPSRTTSSRTAGIARCPPRLPALGRGRAFSLRRGPASSRVCPATRWTSEATRPKSSCWTTSSPRASTRWSITSRGPRFRRTAPRSCTATSFMRWSRPVTSMASSCCCTSAMSSPTPRPSGTSIATRSWSSLAAAAISARTSRRLLTSAATGARGRNTCCTASPG